MSDDNKEGAAEPVAWQHVANEWADMATSGIQAVRNIIDGIETPEAVLANMNFCYSHCAEVQSRAKATPPAVMPAAPSDADALLRLAKKHGAYITGDNPGDTATFRPHELVAFVAALSQTMQPQAKKAKCQATQRSDGVWQCHRTEWECGRCERNEPAAGEQAGAVADILQFAPKLPGVSSAEPTLERIIWRYYLGHIDNEQEAQNYAATYVDALRTALAAPGAAIAAREQAACSDIPKGDLSKVWQAADDVCEWLNYEVSEKSPGLLKSIETLNEAMGRAEIRAGRAVKTAVASRKEAPVTPQAGTGSKEH